jgi:carboxyl-terminal processing protease
MQNEDIGYVKISRFAGTTYDEFMKAMGELKNQGMNKVILDLRGDPGGYLDQAFKIASEFIPRGEKIVYTKSRVNNFNEEYVSDGGKYTEIPLIVLVNGGSASASEIVSGAVQDLDRGLVVGETTFGKGLVQRQFDLPDGSAFRVTTARYYTPSGRLIQKPYNGSKYLSRTNTDVEGSDTELNKDPQDTTRPVFKTNGGRTVYGGGGITPDYIVKLDTLTNYSVQLRRLNLFYIYTERYMASNKSYIKSTFKTPREFRDGFEVNETMLSDLRELALTKDLEYNYDEFQKDQDFIKSSIKFQIARDLWGNNGSYQVWVNNDEQFLKAVSLFDEAVKLANLKQ